MKKTSKGEYASEALRIAAILAGERCENCDGPGPTNRVGTRLVCKRCTIATEDD